MNQPPEKLTPLDHSAQNRCFGCGEANPVGLHLDFFLAEDGSVVGFPNVSDLYEGPKGYVHGGMIATLLDEAMSKAVRAQGLIAMTRHMEIDYLRPVPSAVAHRLESRITRSDGRKHWTTAKILNHAGTAIAEAKGLFVEVRPRLTGQHPQQNSTSGSSATE